MNLENVKVKNEMELLKILPVELWRIVDEFSDAKTHTRLRASCSSLMAWIPHGKKVDFEEYERLWKEVQLREWREGRKKAFQEAVHMNPQTITQKHYGYLCGQELFLEVFRICKLALLSPFTCSNIDISAYDNRAIKWASSQGHADIVHLLLSDPRVNPAASDNYALKLASYFGHVAVVQLLLSDPRVNPAADDNYALKTASENGRAALVQLLLSDPRVNPAANDNYAIKLASEYGHAAAAQLLLADPRVDPAAHNNYAIKWASNNGHAAVVELLLADSRFSPAVLDKNGIEEAIRSASKNGHSNVAEILQQRAVEQEEQQERR
jgi:hypothetical protein